MRPRQPQENLQGSGNFMNPTVEPTFMFLHDKAVATRSLHLWHAV